MTTPSVERDEVEKRRARINRLFAGWSIKRVVTAGIAILLAGLWVAYSARETAWFEGMIPAALETQGFATVSRDKSLPAIVFEGLMGVRYTSCGGVTFSLTPRALAAIDAEGLAFLDLARQPRGNRRRYPRPPRDFAPWRETPMPSGWTELGPWLGLDCMGWPRTRARIFNAARESGSYYTTTYNAALLVIPRLGIAVFTFRGI